MRRNDGGRECRPASPCLTEAHFCGKTKTQGLGPIGHKANPFTPKADFDRDFDFDFEPEQDLGE